MSGEMWTYWRDKKGILHALEDQYAYVLESDDMLRMAYHNAKLALANIDALMKEKGL